MNKKITPKNIAQIWDEALNYYKRYELENALLRLTHWVDQNPQKTDFANDLRVLLAVANLAMNDLKNSATQSKI